MYHTGGFSPTTTPAKSTIPANEPEFARCNPRSKSTGFDSAISTTTCAIYPATTAIITYTPWTASADCDECVEKVGFVPSICLRASRNFISPLDAIIILPQNA
jgi:hypothetical protein